MFNHNYFNQLQRGSYRGAEFLIRSGELVGGRKTVAYEFPNNNYRFIEDMGGLLEVFNITAVISGTRYKYHRDKLRKALETPGIGVLVHPFAGRFNVVPEPYTLRESLTELGVATFEMVFKVATDKQFPKTAVDNRSEINKFSQDVLDSATQAVEDLYEVTDKWRQNYQDALDTLNNLVQAFDTITEPFQSFQDALAEFTVLMNNFKSSLTNDIKRPGQLATNIEALFTSSNNLGQSSQDRFNYSQQLFNFGNNFYYPPERTPATRQRNLNRRLISQQANISALANAYLDASLIDYMDEDHLNNTQKILENQYEYVLSLEDITNDNVNSLRQLRTRSKQVFDSLRQNVKRIIDVKTNPTSLTALTYQYYDNLDNDKLIMNINNILVPNRIQGDIRVVSE